MKTLKHTTITIGATIAAIELCEEDCEDSDGSCDFDVVVTLVIVVAAGVVESDMLLVKEVVALVVVVVVALVVVVVHIVP